MKEPPFSIAEAVRFGWKETRAHSGLIFQAMLTVIALGLLGSFFNAERTTLATLLGIAVSLLQVAAGIGFVIITLKLAKGEPTFYRDIVPPWNIAWRYLLASLVTGVVIVLGYLVPIGLGVLAWTLVPSWPGYVVAGVLCLAGVALGTCLLLRYLLVRFIAVDGVHAVIDILRESRKLSSGILGRLLLFLLTVIGLNILGVAAVFVGLLVSIPVTILASAHVYLILRAESEIEG